MIKQRHQWLICIAANFVLAVYLAKSAISLWRPFDFQDMLWCGVVAVALASFSYSVPNAGFKPIVGSVFLTAMWAVMMNLVVPMINKP